MGSPAVTPEGYMRTTRYQAPENGIITMVSVHCHGRYVTTPAMAKIYADEVGVDGVHRPGALLAESSEVLLHGGGVPSWYNFILQTPLPITAGTWYWFAIHAQDEHEITLDDTFHMSGQTTECTHLTYPRNPNPFYEPGYSYVPDPWNITDDPPPYGITPFQLAIYATYEPQFVIPDHFSGPLGAVVICLIAFVIFQKTKSLSKFSAHLRSK